MALELSYTSPSGFTAAEAYCRIVKTEVIKDTDQTTVYLNIYYDAAARIADAAPIGSDILYLDLPFDTSWADIYTEIKTLDAYSGATDVL